MDLERKLLNTKPHRAHLAVGGRTQALQGLGEGSGEGIVVPCCFAHLRGASAPPGCTGGAGVAARAAGRWGMPSCPHAVETLVPTWHCLHLHPRSRCQQCSRATTSLQRQPGGGQRQLSRSQRIPALVMLQPHLLPPQPPSVCTFRWTRRDPTPGEDARGDRRPAGDA